MVMKNELFQFTDEEVEQAIRTVPCHYSTKAHDLKTQAPAQSLLAASAVSASTPSAGVDMVKFDDLLNVTIDVGTITVAGTSIAVKIQESADNSTGWVDCQLANGSYPTLTGAGITELTIQRTLRYIRFNPTVTGGSNFIMSVTAREQLKYIGS
jgi:hypothetical protein